MIKLLRTRTALALVRTAGHLLSLATVVRGKPLVAPGPGVASKPVERELPEDVRYLISDPVMEKRRVEFNVHEVMHLIWEALHRRGAPLSDMVKGKWIWVGGAEGQPHLYFIRPGVES